MSTIEFNHMLVTNSQTMRGFAMNFTRNGEDADDLVQDTLLKALKYKDHFADGTNFKGWLYTIMRNIFLNNCKKHQLGNKIFVRPNSDLRWNQTEVIRTDITTIAVSPRHLSLRKARSIINRLTLAVGQSRPPPTSVIRQSSHVQSTYV